MCFHRKISEKFEPTIVKFLSCEGEGGIDKNSVQKQNTAVSTTAEIAPLFDGNAAYIGGFQEDR